MLAIKADLAKIVLIAPVWYVSSRFLFPSRSNCLQFDLLAQFTPKKKHFGGRKVGSVAPHRQALAPHWLGQVSSRQEGRNLGGVIFSSRPIKQNNQTIANPTHDKTQYTQKNNVILILFFFSKDSLQITNSIFFFFILINFFFLFNIGLYTCATEHQHTNASGRRQTSC